MTLFALGLKCGWRGASGSVTLGAAAPNTLAASSNEASAIEPKPTPHWRKNQRRVTSRAYSERSSSSKFMAQDKSETPEARNANESRTFGFRQSGFGFPHHSFVIVSSRFKIARLTIAHAATLCKFTSGGIFFKSATATLTAAAVRFSK